MGKNPSRGGRPLRDNKCINVISNRLGAIVKLNWEVEVLFIVCRVWSRSSRIKTYTIKYNNIVE